VTSFPQPIPPVPPDDLSNEEEEEKNPPPLKEDERQIYDHDLHDHKVIKLEKEHPYGEWECLM